MAISDTINSTLSTIDITDIRLDSIAIRSHTASDVSASNNTVAFKSGQEQDTYVSYVKW